MPSITISLPRDLETIDQLTYSYASEVLLEHQDLARLGHLDKVETNQAIHFFNSQEKACVLVWDILADDQQIEKGLAVLKELDLANVAAIRVADPGVATCLKSHYPHIRLQLSLETGNHNLLGIQAWERIFAPQKLVLSNELPLSQISHIRSQISTPVEISVLGRILLFYTPRHLLKPIDPWSHQEVDRSQFVTSVEDGKHFPIEENRHGTFMYYEKDLFLVPYLQQIMEAGVDHVRLDLKFFNSNPLGQLLEQHFSGSEVLALIKSCLGPKLTRGFFKSNRTDKQFKKLKNLRLQPQENRDYLGTVLEVRKNQYIAQMLEKPLQVGEHIVYQTPEGTLLPHQIAWLRDKDGQQLHQTQRPGLVLVNHRRSISPGTLIFRQTQST